MSSSPGPAPARGPAAGGRVGLSEYTAQRLAELRARRAEAESTDFTFVKPAPAPRPSPSTSRAGTLTAADSAARSLNASSDVAAVNGLKTETPTTAASVGSYSSYSSQRTAATDATSPHTETYSSTVGSPLRRPQQQPQQQHQYITASSGRTASSSACESARIAVDMNRSHQVTATATVTVMHGFHHSVAVFPLPFRRSR